MESRNFIRPFLALLIGIGLVILVVVLIVKAFSGGSSAPSSSINITQYTNTGASATLLVDSPTNINQDHRQVKITVSPTENEIDIIQGYQGNVIDSKAYPNNTSAWETFLQTLNLLDFSKGSTSTADYRGYCPTGERYIFTFNGGNGNLFSYWATSCGGQGTYEGKLGPTLEQFHNQIPENDYGQLTSSISTGF